MSVQWARSAAVSVNSEDDFYTNEVVKRYYKNHVKAVLNRYNTFTKIAYKDDAMIMTWELINEPRCQTDCSGRTVNGWIQETASYTKSQDNKHLLEIGMESFHRDSMPDKKQHNPGYQVGTDFITYNLIKETDFAPIHAYPDQWLSGQSEQAHSAFMEQCMRRNWEDARNILKKSLVFTEFAKSKKDDRDSVFSRDTLFDTIYRNIYSYASAGGSMAGGLVWHVTAEGMEMYHDGYEIVLSKDTSTSGVISRQCHAMAELASTMSV